MRLWSVRSPTEAAPQIKAGGQRYKQAGKFVFLGGAISADAKISIETNRRISAKWTCIRKFGSQLYDRPNGQLSLKVGLVEAEVVGAVWYGCATWTLRSEDFDSLRTSHLKLLLRLVGFRREDRKCLQHTLARSGARDDHCERIETTIRKDHLWFREPLSGRRKHAVLSAS
ncbi:unnamed protein product [Sphacelaria rigidula]